MTTPKINDEWEIVLSGGHHDICVIVSAPENATDEELQSLAVTEAMAKTYIWSKKRPPRKGTNKMENKTNKELAKQCAGRIWDFDESPNDTETQLLAAINAATEPLQARVKELSEDSKAFDTLRDYIVENLAFIFPSHHAEAELIDAAKKEIESLRARLEKAEGELADWKGAGIKVATMFTAPFERKIIDAPASCQKCGSQYVSLTTGNVLNVCHCGGELKTQSQSSRLIPLDHPVLVEMEKFSEKLHEYFLCTMGVSDIPDEIWIGFTESLSNLAKLREDAK